MFRGRPSRLLGERRLKWGQVSLSLVPDRGRESTLKRPERAAAVQPLRILKTSQPELTGCSHTLRGNCWAQNPSSRIRAAGQRQQEQGETERGKEESVVLSNTCHQGKPQGGGCTIYGHHKQQKAELWDDRKAILNHLCSKSSGNQFHTKFSNRKVWKLNLYYCFCLFF